MNGRDRLITGHFVEFLKTVLDNFDTDKNSFTDLYTLYTKS